jgi:hypothetical protein
MLWVVLAWAAIRTVMLLVATGHAGPLDHYGRKSQGDIYDYMVWANDSLVHLRMPTTDLWQYPPLIAPLLLLPKLLPFMGYIDAFVLLTFLADAAIMAILVWTAARRQGRLLGVWYWTLSVPMLGTIIYGRFDVFPSLLVIVALALLGVGVPAGPGRKELNGRRWFAGGLIGIGAAMKVWPGLAVFALPRTKRGVQTAIVGALTGGLATFAVGELFQNGWGFLHAQKYRGTEIESVWAIPFLTARKLHLWHGRIEYRYGSYEVVGPWVVDMTHLALLSTVVAFGLLAWWWLRATWRPAVVADATLVATMLMIVTSRVISPQYMIWLLATASFCLLFKDSSQRRSAVVLLACMPLTQLEFPFGFIGLIYYHTSPFLVLALRDLLLVVAAVVGFVDLWRGTVEGRLLTLEPLRGLWHRKSAAGTDAEIEAEIDAAIEAEPGTEPESADSAPATEPTLLSGSERSEAASNA